MGHSSKCIISSSGTSFRSTVEQTSQSFVQICSGHLPKCFRCPEISDKCAAPVVTNRRRRRGKIFLTLLFPSSAAAWQKLTLQVIIFEKWNSVSAFFSCNLCFYVTMHQNLICRLQNTKLHDFVIGHKIQDMKWKQPTSWQLLTSLGNLKK